MAYFARIKNNICTNAHPLGCYQNVHDQVQVATQTQYQGPNMALVVGASSGIGLASRMSLAFGAGADTLGVYHERAAQPHKFGTAGWYNVQGFEYYARRSGLAALSTNQDAFQKNAKDWVIQKLRHLDKPLELLVYSLAAPRRKVRGVGEYKSVIKPIDGTYNGQTLDVFESRLRDQVIEPATAEEIDDTIKVMGGEDWQEWVNVLKEAGVLADNFKTVAYSYLGPEQTQDIYGSGTLGRAKAHLHDTAVQINKVLEDNAGGSAKIGLFQALVTPSSAVIPSMPLYLSILHKTLKESGKYETTLDQTIRLLSQGLYGGDPSMHEGNLIRVDNLECDSDIQRKVADVYEQINQENLMELADVIGFKQSFLRQFGFNRDTVDYKNRPDPLLLPAVTDISTRERCIA